MNPPPSDRFARSAERFQPPPPVARKRMLAQGRKAHFFYDLKGILSGSKMDPSAVPAFCETLFQRGTRGSTEEAKAFVMDKAAEKDLFTPPQRQAILNLVERYSFWR